LKFTIQTQKIRDLGYTLKKKVMQDATLMIFQYWTISIINIPIFDETKTKSIKNAMWILYLTRLVTNENDSGLHIKSNNMVFSLDLF